MTWQGSPYQSLAAVLSTLVNLEKVAGAALSVQSAHPPPRRARKDPDVQPVNAGVLHSDSGISRVSLSARVGHGFTMQPVTTARKIGRNSSPSPRRFSRQATVPLSSRSRKL